MRKIFALLFIAGTLRGFSQVQYRNISYQEALNQSKTEGKLIFLQLESENCRQCTEVAEKGLSDKEVGQMINEAFIPLHITAKHPDRKAIESHFRIKNYFGSLFLDHSGTLIHNFAGTTSISSQYREQADIALHKAGENLKLNQLESLYLGGNKSIGLLEQILVKKKELLIDNSAQLDEYVTLLPADSLSSVRTLQFIASMAPVLGSKADAALRGNDDLFKAAWYAMPLNTRININNRIIAASLTKAVRQKDEQYALRIATFAQNVVTTSKAAGEKAYTMRMMEYYDRTENTPKYLVTAVHYYDTYLMTISPDSIKRMDEALTANRIKEAPKDTVKTPTGYVVKSTVRTAAFAQRFTNELKEGAWNIYKRTADPALLEKATAWIKRGLEFYDSYEALDTYAHLLYKQQQKEQAINAEKEAIEQKKKRGLTVKDNEATLQKMEKGLPLEG